MVMFKLGMSCGDTLNTSSNWIKLIDNDFGYPPPCKISELEMKVFDEDGLHVNMRIMYMCIIGNFVYNVYYILKYKLYIENI